MSTELIELYEVEGTRNPQTNRLKTISLVRFCGPVQQDGSDGSMLQIMVFDNILKNAKIHLNRNQALILADCIKQAFGG